VCIPNSSDQLSIKALIEIERESVSEASVIKGWCSGEDKCDRDDAILYMYIRVCVYAHVHGCVHAFIKIHTPTHTPACDRGTRVRIIISVIREIKQIIIIIIIIIIINYYHG